MYDLRERGIIILSICIPSYNRFECLREHLKIIFSAKSQDFEVVLVDNASPRNIYKELGINDPRLRIIRRTHPVRPTRNVNECVFYAKGKFAFLYLDKDRVLAGGVDEFLHVLRQRGNVLNGGICRIHQQASEASGKVRWYNRRRALIRCSYLRKHPSGSFYKTDILKSVYKHMSPKEMESDFGHDLLLTLCASYPGKIMIYDKPFLLKETKEEALAITTYYPASTEQEQWFYPTKLIEDMTLYLHHFQKVRCEKFIRYIVIFRLYNRIAQKATVEFKDFMKDEIACKHQRIAMRQVSQEEMINWLHAVNLAFLSSHLVNSMMNIMIKYGIYAIVNYNIRRKIWKV